MTGPMEVSWFSALCDDDYEYLGVPEDRLKSSLAHCGEITQAAEKGGFDDRRQEVLIGPERLSPAQFRRVLDTWQLDIHQDYIWSNLVGDLNCRKPVIEEV